MLPFFWNCIKPYKWYYAVMLMAPIVGSFYPIANNYAIKLFVDLLSLSEESISFTLVALPIALLISAEIILNLVWRISDIAEWKSEPKVRKAILTKTYDYLQHHSYPFFQDRFSGSLTSKVKGVLEGYDHFAGELHHRYIGYAVSIIIGITSLSLVHLELVGVMALWIAIAIPVMYKMSIKTGRLSADQSNSKHKAIGLVSDKISNIIAVLSFASRKRERKTLENMLESEFIPKQVRMYQYNFQIYIIGFFLYMVLLVAIIVLMVTYRKENLISIGDFAFVFTTLMHIGDQVFRFSIGLADLFQKAGDLKSSFEILKEPHEAPDMPKAKSIVVQKAAIDLQKVHFTYKDGKSVLKDFNLSIQAGEKVGLVGHSGAGKSTLVNLLLRYFQINRGTIEIDGQNTAAITQDSLRENIAIIPQEPMLFHRSLLENIRYGKPEANEAEVIEVSQKAHIHDFIAELPAGYQTEVGERGIKLSGGQRQRIAIARAMLKDAPILILDEATSSLDSQTEQKVQESLQHLISKRNTTVIAIAHRLSTLRQMDRILVLDKGCIVQEGTHEALLEEDGLYKELWEAQVVV